ncbi:hypothetical protein C8R45DRAFT_1114261 [Mycena sanguinolenta]|nr:hypothetical protein C8R45DRAFT_1114261 [Mycena sanguinolenta]
MPENPTHSHKIQHIWVLFRNNDTSQQNRHGAFRRPANQARSIVSRCDAVLSSSIIPSRYLLDAHERTNGALRSWKWNRGSVRVRDEARQQSGSVAGLLTSYRSELYQDDGYNRSSSTTLCRCSTRDSLLTALEDGSPAPTGAGTDGARQFQGGNASATPAIRSQARTD